MKYTLTLLLLIFSVHTYSIKNWLPYINNISRMEYGGGTQNWTITRDNNGWIYAANNSGLLQFDGYSWHLFSNGMIIRTAYHDGKDHQAKDEEDVLVLLFHVSTRSFTLPWVRASWEWRSVPSRSRLSSPCRVWGADGHPPGRRRRGCGKCRWP